jgi:hypothetical protein
MIFNRSRCCIVMLGVLSASAAAQADTINIVASRDNTLYESATGSLSNGAGPTCFVGRSGTGQIRRALLQFDLSSIPVGATINVVTLSLNMSMSNAGATDVSLHRVVADWGEGTSNAGISGGGGAPSTPGDATWIHTFFDTSLWSTPGGDFIATSSATTSVGALGTYTWSSAQMLADVQRWIAGPVSNFGWILRGDEVNNNSSKRFDTRENETAANHPTLIIDYTPIPAPASFLTLLAGVLVARRKRVA